MLWRNKRKEIIKRDNGECQLCKEEGRVSKGMVVHHIKHYDKYPELGLTNENLITLCSACHNKVHPEKNFKESKNHKEKWE